jgi:hypothetical protein
MHAYVLSLVRSLRGGTHAWQAWHTAQPATRVSGARQTYLTARTVISATPTTSIVGVTLTCGAAALVGKNTAACMCTSSPLAAANGRPGHPAGGSIGGALGSVVDVHGPTALGCTHCVLKELTQQSARGMLCWYAIGVMCVCCMSAVCSHKRHRSRSNVVVVQMCGLATRTYGDSFH